VPSLDWEAVAAVLVHPTQLAILQELAYAREPLSPTGIADRLLARGMPVTLGTVSYHVRQLRDRALVTAAGERPRRGALEHFYVPSPAILVARRRRAAVA
jgi:DNA-binding transcriptional ArsR family regulator